VEWNGGTSRDSDSLVLFDEERNMTLQYVELEIPEIPESPGGRDWHYISGVAQHESSQID